MEGSVTQEKNPKPTPENLDSLVQKITLTHETLHASVVKAVDSALVLRNFLIGHYITEFEGGGTDWSEIYGKRLLKTLSERLKEAGLRGVSATNLRLCRRFFECYQKMEQALPLSSLTQSNSDRFTSKDSLKNSILEMEQALPAPSFAKNLQASPFWVKFIEHFTLSWTHYIALVNIESPDERRFYEIEATKEDWGAREMERQIESGLYERLSLSRDKDAIKRLAQEGQVIERSTDLIKDPYILEFTGLEWQNNFSEHTLEAAIIEKIEHFLLELGKGFLFEARQKRFSFDNRHFFVDLVFYNRLLRSYVLIDLKVGDLKHQDLGQMQMYTNYYDRHVKTKEEGPTVGILLCKSKSDEMVELTLPKDSNIYASQYQLYMPSKEDFKKQLEEAQREWEDQQRRLGNIEDG